MTELEETPPEVFDVYPRLEMVQPPPQPVTHATCGKCGSELMVSNPKCAVEVMSPTPKRPTINCPCGAVNRLLAPSVIARPNPRKINPKIITRG